MNLTVGGRFRSGCNGSRPTHRFKWCLIATLWRVQRFFAVVTLILDRNWQHTMIRAAYMANNRKNDCKMCFWNCDEFLFHSNLSQLRQKDIENNGRPTNKELMTVLFCICCVNSRNIAKPKPLRINHKTLLMCAENANSLKWCEGQIKLFNSLSSKSSAWSAWFVKLE